MTRNIVLFSFCLFYNLKPFTIYFFQNLFSSRFVYYPKIKIARFFNLAILELIIQELALGNYQIFSELPHYFKARYSSFEITVSYNPIASPS